MEFPISINEDTKEINSSFIDVDRISSIITEKNTMYDEIAMHDIPAFFIDATKLNFCSLIKWDFVFFDLLDFVITPIIIEEITVEIYRVIPKIVLLKIPIPTPAITNATEGFVDISTSR